MRGDFGQKFVAPAHPLLRRALAVGDLPAGQALDGQKPPESVHRSVPSFSASFKLPVCGDRVSLSDWTDGFHRPDGVHWLAIMLVSG